MANICKPPVPKSGAKLPNKPYAGKVYVLPSPGGSPRPESGQMYPRTK